MSSLAKRLTDYANRLTEVGQRNMLAPYVEVAAKGQRELAIAADIREARDEINLLNNLALSLNRKLVLAETELGARRAAMDTALSAMTNAAQLIDGFRLGKGTDDWSEWDEVTRRAISYSLERFHSIKPIGDDAGEVHGPSTFAVAPSSRASESPRGEPAPADPPPHRGTP